MEIVDIFYQLLCVDGSGVVKQFEVVIIDYSGNSSGYKLLYLLI